MILHNKKTGEIIKNACIGVFMHKSSGDCERVDTEARSLEKVLEEWEDYKPKEPLIKDEKIRKAVRAWAEASYLRGAIFDFDDGTMILRGENHRAYISFDGLDFCEFRHITAEYHTITELCGEEEA